jgi:hypothetical protein
MHICALYALTFYIPLLMIHKFIEQWPIYTSSQLWDECTALNAAMLESANIL